MVRDIRAFALRTVQPKLVLRVHPCYGDGVAFMGVLLALTDRHPEPNRMRARMPIATADAVARPADFCGQSSLALQEGLMQVLGSHAAAVMTNVPGPERRLRLAGAEIEQLMFWVPQSADIALGASILSYAGHLQLGLMTDGGRVREPERIVAHFPDEIEKMERAIG